MFVLPEKKLRDIFIDLLDDETFLSSDLEYIEETVVSCGCPKDEVLLCTYRAMLIYLKCVEERVTKQILELKKCVN